MFKVVTIVHQNRSYTCYNGFFSSAVGWCQTESGFTNQESFGKVATGKMSGDNGGSGDRQDEGSGDRQDEDEEGQGSRRSEFKITPLSYDNWGFCQRKCMERSHMPSRKLSVSKSGHATLVQALELSNVKLGLYLDGRLFKCCLSAAAIP